MLHPTGVRTYTSGEPSFLRESASYGYKYLSQGVTGFQGVTHPSASLAQVHYWLR